MDGQPTNQSPGRQVHQRKLKNYLLDKKFQLKYTGIVIAITALLSVVLGYYLHREIVISQNTILARDLAADSFVIGPGDFEKRLEVSQVLDQEFNDALVTKLAVVVKINNAPAGTAADLYRDSFGAELRRTTSVLVAALLVFLVVLAAVWVYLTHKIAGPVYKLKLLFSRVTGDKLAVVGSLRKGDELQDAFIAFQDMVERLRDDRRAKAAQVAAAIEQLEAGGKVQAEDLADLRALHRAMSDSAGG